MLLAFPSLSQIGTPIMNEERKDGIMHSDPILNHSFRRSVRFHDVKRNPAVVFHINAQGWLSKTDTAKHKNESTYRIFYVGDSNTQGAVPWDKRLANLMQTRLSTYFSNSDTQIEVINSGVASYSTLIYYLLIKTKILEYNPDLVIINLDMTDVPNDSIYRRRLVHDKDGDYAAVLPFDLKDKEKYRMNVRGNIEIEHTSEFLEGLYKLSALYRLAVGAYFNYAGYSENIYFAWMPWHFKTDRSADWLQHEWSKSIQDNVDFSMQVLGKTIQLLQQNNIAVIVTTVPHYPQFTGEWSDQPHQRVKQTVQEAGGLYIDTFGELKKLHEPDGIGKLYFAHDHTHFNIPGNKAWADIQYRFILDHKNLINLP